MSPSAQGETRQMRPLRLTSDTMSGLNNNKKKTFALKQMTASLNAKAKLLRRPKTWEKSYGQGAVGWPSQMPLRTRSAD